MSAAPGRPTTIGLIAGRGQFPALAARGAQTLGHRVAAVGFKGFTDPALENEVHAWTLLGLGQINRLVRFFHGQKATHLCFAGAIDKPKALDLRPDLRALRLLGRLRGKGDDALLRALIGELESEGFQVIQAADLVPDLRGPAGVLSTRKPDPEEWDDLRFAYATAKDVGRLDIGQCIVVKRGIVAAVEAMEGTDETLRRGGKLARGNAVAVKTLKPGQEERIDLPALGTGTVDSCIAANISCLGFEAGKALFFDLEESLRRADAAGLAIVGITPELLAAPCKN
ncbi:MAG: UDP-2,3-diacylglucosamine diphosphatase LpxI [Desulfovibrionaceae bacterium]|jgi:DUF1009 family protein|nr:UDP-2,3-diacylglucosamine diphosphatase LpxI [Desulfovibrionaceae bacterium]